MIRAIFSGLSALLLVSACAPTLGAPRSKPFSAPPAPRVSASPQPEFRGYRLAPSYVEKGPFRDGAPLRTGALLGGLRLRTDASGLSSADSVADPPLIGGVRLPSHLGGGLLFWNSRALYTADTFLGLLSPLLDVGFTPEAVGFGPNFILVHGAHGQRIALDLHARQRVAFSEPLLVDVESTAEGHVLSLLEGGKGAFSVDGGKTYQALSLPPAERLLNVSLDGNALLAELSSGGFLRLEESASRFVDAARPEPPNRRHGDALWPVAEPPLERALRFGVPIGEEFAGVAVAGSVATVNLRTGELVQMTRALVPSDLECRALDASGGLLLACMSQGHGTIVLSDVFGERPVTQAKFPAGVGLAFAEGVLLAASRCDGEQQPGAVCVRGADGRFHDYDVSAKLAALAQNLPALAAGSPKGSAPQIAVSRWIPKQDGGALAVVTGPQPGFLDAQSGSFVSLAPEVPRVVLDAPRGKDSWLGLDWVALRDGGVRGWLPSAGVGIGRDGRLDPSVYEFRVVVAAGSHALAFDKGRHAFQSSDWGHTWVETLAPPGSASGSVSISGQRCSVVGCHLGPWLRVGWEPEVPAALSRWQVAPRPNGLPAPERPVLTCGERAPVALSRLETDGDPARTLNFGVSQPAVTDGMFRSGFTWSTLHPIIGDGFPNGLRAGLNANLPDTESEVPPSDWRGYGASLPYVFVSAFDPSARVHRSSITWRARFAAAALTQSDPPILQPESYGLYPAIPVLSREVGQTDGLLVDDGSPVWLHDTAPAEALSLGLHAGGTLLISAIATGPRTLVVLASGAEGTTDVIEVAAGKARRLFALPTLAPALYPANPDALAVGPRGELAVLRARSGSEPASDADPLLLLDENGAVTPLARWSKLYPADALECKAALNDYRAVLETTRSWLTLAGDDSTAAAETEEGMFAMIRINPDRVCLEAVEVPQLPDPYPAHVVARFASNRRGAASVGFSPGVELRQPLDCALSAPH